MGVISLVICIICYVLTAADFASKKNWAMTLVFLAYALANVGFIMALKGTSGGE